MNTILIIDDHAGFRVQARAILEADGFTVVGEAGDGTSGLAAARALRPDLVLLDIGLPDIEGFDVANELAVDGPPPLVVLTSSRDASAYGPRLAGSRALGFIPKDELSGAAIRAMVAGAVTLRVVLADDSLLLREGIARLLAEAGFDVVAQAGDAEALLAAVREHAAGRRDRRHPDAADPHRRGPEGGRGDPRRARHGGRHPGAVAVRRADVRPAARRRTARAASATCSRTGSTISTTLRTPSAGSRGAGRSSIPRSSPSWSAGAAPACRSTT